MLKKFQEYYLLPLLTVKWLCVVFCRIVYWSNLLRGICNWIDASPHLLFAEHKYSYFRLSWTEEEKKKSLGLHREHLQNLFTPPHAHSTNRRRGRAPKSVPSMCFFALFFLELLRDMKRWVEEKRWRGMMAPCCHTPAKRTERRVLSHRIRVICGHTSLRAKALMLGEERRGAF